MSADRSHATPEQPRELANRQTRILMSRRDRRIHAVGTAVLGLTGGLYMAAQNLLSGTSRVVLSCIVVASWVAQALWIERAAPTIPRRARLWSHLGIGGSLVLALGLVLPWLNLRAQTEPASWPAVLLG